MPSEKQGLYIFLGIFIILIIIGGLIFWKYDQIRDFIKREEKSEEEIVYAELKLFARDRQNNIIEVDYQVIDNSSRILQRGTLKKEIIEQFKDTKENRSYILNAFGSGYYENSQTCPLNQDSCTVILDKIATQYVRVTKIKDDFSVGLVYLEDGVIIEPILCTKWENLVTFSINMSSFKVPVQYYNEYDKCYSFNKNLTSGLHQFNINHKLTQEQPNTFEIDFIDKCDGKYIKEECALTISVKSII